ncbi:MAG TPA: hypothetical protein PK001_01980 [Dokdonella sp.]|uniref:hypothetical protein n=3 Tax=Dokdonella sp. TaxID=2291710 RepID=UPI002BF0D58C|nr:hypothetical protein [Dokdonella sp.]HOX70486.1 hypothetical protein [Dokdonella sp.]
MKFPTKTLGLLFASLALASCGGGGGDGGAVGPPLNGTITLTTTRTTLPLNPNNVLPYPGSPYMAEVAFTYRNNAGVITALTNDATFTTSSPSTVSLSSPDDPTTTDINELAQRFVSFHDTTNNGSYVFFATSYDVAGTSTITASATDPSTNQTVTKTLVFTVAGTTPLPAALDISPSPASVYIPGSGGSTNSVIRVQVRDGANQPVPNPGAVDNVRFEIVGSTGGAILSTTSSTGPATGPSVSSQTINGIATASFQAGTTQGPIQIRATVDRSDNNVSNGIGDAISATTTVVVSDGKLFSLTLASPIINALRVNRVSDGVVPPADLEPPGDDGIPPDPDATYSLTVSALAKDRQGNPVVPGTVIRFGVVDEPFNVAADEFSMSGSDGDAQEGGTLFTSVSGEFVTGGGGAGPGDVLVVFGKEVQGNSDLESALTVQRINSQTSLNTSSSFNLNNTTGSTVNYGPVLPYVVARAEHGNITATGVTNDIGRASANLNYTISTLGYLNVIWAQGESVDTVTGGAKRVTDAEIGSYPGLAPGTIVASPSPIIGNRSEQVQVCLYDAMLAPLQRARIGFSFQLTQGTGSVDGVSGSGILGTSTGANGCAIAHVVTSGLTASTETEASGTLTFSLGGLTTSVNIIVNLATLQVAPSAITVPAAGITRTITITARDTGGSAIPGVAITGACTASGGAGATIAPATFGGVTGPAGSTTHTVTASNFIVPGTPTTPPVSGSGVCTYTTPQGLSASVSFNGVIQTADCGGFSPCP